MRFSFHQKVNSILKTNKKEVNCRFKTKNCCFKIFLMEKKTSHKGKEKSKLLFLEAFDDIIQPNVVNLAPVPKFKTEAVSLEEQTAVYEVRHTNKYHLASMISPGEAVMPSLAKSTRDKDSTIRFSYSAIDAIESARNGIKFHDFKKIYDVMKLSNSRWAEIIGISERTMQSILKEKKNLDQNKSEKLLSFLTLIEYAISVLGNEKNVEEWLHYKAPSLHGKAPIDYVDTFQGIQMLREQLFKIETGNLV